MASHFLYYSFLILMLVKTIQAQTQGILQIASGPTSCNLTFQNIVTTQQQEEQNNQANSQSGAPAAAYVSNCTTTQTACISQDYSDCETPVTYCVDPGCNGVWVTASTYNSGSPPVPMYCCACTTPDCGFASYQNEGCAAVGGYIVTQDYGATWVCMNNNVCGGIFEEDSDGNYTCVDQTCSGYMIQGCPIETCYDDGFAPLWTCIDSTCLAVNGSLGMIPRHGNTDWVCGKSCGESPTGTYAYGKMWNVTSNTVINSWICGPNDFIIVA